MIEREYGSMLCPSLAHLAIPPGMAPGLTVHLFGSASGSVPLPRAASAKRSRGSAQSASVYHVAPQGFAPAKVIHKSLERRRKGGTATELRMVLLRREGAAYRGWHQRL